MSAEAAGRADPAWDPLSLSRQLASNPINVKFHPVDAKFNRSEPQGGGRQGILEQQALPRPVLAFDGVRRDVQFPRDGFDVSDPQSKKRT